MISFPAYPNLINLSEIDLDKEEIICKVGVFDLAQKNENLNRDGGNIHTS